MSPSNPNPFDDIVYRLMGIERGLSDLMEKLSSTQKSDDADELLTPEETAQTLKVSKVTVWDWSKRGILNPRRIGNKVRYLRSEVLSAARPKGGVMK
ncbi:helix-turn-helix domain-containing protein [Spirosoma sp. HMF4905]|uniref:Helix-turn-helix domain-containing protein n=1 Tax=Spirosoma arboris TaxID=2682092 RepID=A0A7K1SRD1_9BACT|nr:helix-turn-helix domain-containing protein [Spirosoma arboris]MVM36337.1 helix-turn-helix domain-containing protein [Spirosoma arboris]